MQYTSRYNVFGANGQVKIAAGQPIDEKEALRQGIIQPKPAKQPAEKQAENKQAANAESK